jgi:DNA-directed RNA polymerase
MKRLQSRLIEGQRPFDIADSQNHVIQHVLSFKSQGLQRSHFISAYRMDRKRRYVHALAASFVG